MVGLLDVDPGQAELTPPGLVSLTCLTTPLLSQPAVRLGCSDAPQPVEQRFIGDVSPSADPAAYAAAVRSLITAWRTTHAPRTGGVLVVNTMGWIRGLGLELLCDLLRSCGPTHLLSVAEEQQQERGVPPGIFWTLPGEPMPQCTVINLTATVLGGPQQQADVSDQPELPAPGGSLAQVKQRTAADLRGLMWAAWCYRAATVTTDAPQPDRDELADTVWADAWAPRTGGGASATALVAEALTRAVPYSVRVSALRVLAVLSSIATQEVWHALNASIVGLGVSAPDSFVPQCLGLALVRSADPAAGTLYLLTPVPVEVAATADMLLLGKLELPTALLMAAPYSSPYVTLGALSGADAAGGGAMRSRNNLQRGKRGGRPQQVP